jgi:hypothetical protein
MGKETKDHMHFFEDDFERGIWGQSGSIHLPAQKIASCGRRHIGKSRRMT